MKIKPEVSSVTSNLTTSNNNTIPIVETSEAETTVMVKDGGITESISKRIPIVLKKIQFSAFPEGGEMVAGLPTRIYIEAKNMLGKPADVEGKIVDDHGSTAATFKTYHFGLGRVLAMDLETEGCGLVAASGWQSDEGSIVAWAEPGAVTHAGIVSCGSSDAR